MKTGPKPRQIKDRLLANSIPEPMSGCWLWLSQRDGGGYPFMCVEGRGRTRKFKKAHRLSYEEFVGKIPAGLDLDHLCRNRACINPQHLEPVTRAVNVQRGLLAKRSPETIEQVRELARSGMKQREIMQKFNLPQSTTSHIMRGETWRNYGF